MRVGWTTLFVSAALVVAAGLAVGPGCKKHVAGCGDGTVDTGEQCDNGEANSDTTPNACRLDCTNAGCGDGVVDTGETCDPPGAGGCMADCTFGTGPACGDGTVDMGEACDDGNTVSGDGCSATCTAECPLPMPVTCNTTVMGDNTTGNSVIGNWDCDQYTETGPEVRYDLEIPAGGADVEVTATVTFTNPDIDLVVSDVTAGCTPGVCFASSSYDFIGTDPESVTFTGTAGSTYAFFVESYEPANPGGPFALEVVCCDASNCGDGVVCGAEPCDDGNTTAGDGCSATCTVEAGYGCYGEPSICGLSFPLSGTSAPALAIPDATPAGVTDVIMIAGSPCTVTGVTVDVDITHTYRGDISLDLLAPDGTTTVALKSPDGGDNAANVVGNFPTTLTPAEPLSGFGGVAGLGNWTLTVADNFMDDNGTLNSWGLNLTCIP